MSIMSRFQVVTEVLGDCENPPEDLAPAGYVLNETTKELSQFYDDLDACELYKESSRSAKSEVQS